MSGNFYDGLDELRCNSASLSRISRFYSSFSNNNQRY